MRDVRDGEGSSTKRNPAYRRLAKPRVTENQINPFGTVMLTYKTAQEVLLVWELRRFQQEEAVCLYSASTQSSPSSPAAKEGGSPPKPSGKAGIGWCLLCLLSFIESQSH